MDKLSSGLKSASSPFLVYEPVDAEIEIINFDTANSETVDLGLEPVVFEQEEPTDTNGNNYSKSVKNKLAVLKCEKNAYEATKDCNEDLIEEGQRVQQEYWDYNKKVSEGYFSQYNPYRLEDFVKTFIKFRKGKKCTQDEVRRDLENYMDKPLTTMMISKFENLNMSGTKMVGIKMLLKFWMKTKNIEENEKTALRANQRRMLEDIRQEKVLNVLDDSIIDEEDKVNVEPSQDVVLTTKDEQTFARFKFDDGILTRQFDCAEVSENVDIDAGVKEKLEKLKQKLRMRKDEETEEKKKNIQMWKERKSLLDQEKGENAAKKKSGRSEGLKGKKCAKMEELAHSENGENTVKKKRGRPFHSQEGLKLEELTNPENGENTVKKKRGRPFNSQKGLKGNKRAKLEELTNPDQNKVVASAKRGKSKKHDKVTERKNKKTEIVKQKRSKSKENKTPKMEKNNSRKGSRCGTCEACSREDCGACKNCLNMVKFGGLGSMRQACTTRICPAKKPSGRKTPQKRNKNGRNKLEKIVAEAGSEASNKIAEDLKSDCGGSGSFEEQMSENITCVHLKPEYSSESDLLKTNNMRVKVSSVLLDEVPDPTSEPENNGQNEASSHEMPELLLASSSHLSGAASLENPGQVASERDSSNFKITFNNSPCFLTNMQALMETEVYNADLKKMMKENSQLTHTYPTDLIPIRNHVSAVLSQNRQPSDGMGIHQSPHEGGDVHMDAAVTHVPKAASVPMTAAVTGVPKAASVTDIPKAASVTDIPKAASVTDIPKAAPVTDVPMTAAVTGVLESNTGGHIQSSGSSGQIQQSNIDRVSRESNASMYGVSRESNTYGDIQESNMDGIIEESKVGRLNTDGDIQDSKEVIVLKLSFV